MTLSCHIYVHVFMEWNGQKSTFWSLISQNNLKSKIEKKSCTEYCSQQYAFFKCSLNGLDKEEKKPFFSRYLKTDKGFLNTCLTNWKNWKKKSAPNNDLNNMLLFKCSLNGSDKEVNKIDPYKFFSKNLNLNTWWTRCLKSRDPFLDIHKNLILLCYLNGIFSGQKIKSLLI